MNKQKGKYGIKELHKIVINTRREREKDGYWEREGDIND